VTAPWFQRSKALTNPGVSTERQGGKQLLLDRAGRAVLGRGLGRTVSPRRCSNPGPGGRATDR
jgi:hypothetical protein